MSKIRDKFEHKIADDFFEALAQAKYGCLEIITPEGNNLNFGTKNSEPNAHIKINNWHVITNIVSKADIGFFEDYSKGNWETKNLEKLLEFVAKNSESLQSFFYGKFTYRAMVYIKHLMHYNNKENSKKNISAHYDLGNDFYKIWLDETMTYSSAIFDEKDCLKTAQINKYQRITDLLSETNQKDVLEVGCGWGGFIDASAQKNFNVDGITISRKQLDYTLERIGKKKLERQSKARFLDYRDLSGSYNNIVSIEMFEAVGIKYWPTYFGKIKDSLNKTGKAVIQTITIDDAVFEKYQNKADFIQTYIFPGGVLPSDIEFKKAASNVGLKTRSSYFFGLDYAKTLQSWLNNFEANLQKVRALGYDERFIKMWRFYLCYCIAGFKAGRINVCQYELVN
jgi:cyclopropane-fatty-acyl-phospholipid synthase